MTDRPAWGQNADQEVHGWTWEVWMTLHLSLTPSLRLPSCLRYFLVLLLSYAVIASPAFTPITTYTLLCRCMISLFSLLSLFLCVC